MNMTFQLSCPHCLKQVTVQIGAKVEAVCAGEDISVNDKFLLWRSSLDSGEIAMLQLAKESGTLDALKQALERSDIDMPGNIDKFFLYFLMRSQQVAIPRDSLQFLLNIFPGRIEVWRYQAIVGILCNKQLVMFAPFIAMRGKSKESGGLTGLTIDHMAMLQNLVKTKWGYVPAGGGLFAKELKKKQFGDFARIGQ